MSELSRLLQEVNRRDPLTVRARAKRIDDRLNFATIAKYQAGTHPAKPDEVTLRALAEAYGLSYTKVQRAAGIQDGAGPYTAPPEASRLSRREQEAITELIMAMAASKIAGGATGPQAQIEFGTLVPDQVPGANEFPEPEPDRKKATYDRRKTSGSAVHERRRKGGQQANKGADRAR